ncbi:unnamed protein product [Rotaria sp. Silwood2]|nr:unnamed protein product [Rotaria sp. Silwood2]CAF4376774.1 unnamed protein product [Rotaria sp. Silwood2]
MSSLSQNSSSTNKIIEIPRDLIKNGNILSIEQHTEIFVNGRHISQPLHFIKQNHGLCLIDNQQQDSLLDPSNHHLDSTNDLDQLFEIIIEFPAEILNAGKSVIIERIDSNENEKSLEYFEDLYKIENLNKCTESMNIHLKLRKEYIQRGKTIIIHKEKIFIINNTDYFKGAAHHITDNTFTKRDYLQLKNMMEMIIKVSPEFFDDDQKLIFRKEDPQTASSNLPDYRQSKHDLELTNKQYLKEKQRVALKDFILNKIWNPILSDDRHLLILSLDFNNKPHIINEDQLKINLDQYNLSVETKDEQDFNIYQEIVLPEIINVKQLKYQFDEENHRLNISLSLH